VNPPVDPLGNLPLIRPATPAQSVARRPRINRDGDRPPADHGDPPPREQRADEEEPDDDGFPHIDVRV
jgi:hypothetical protein